MLTKDERKKLIELIENEISAAEKLGLRQDIETGISESAAYKALMKFIHDEL